jgi:hypothetical protein
MVRPTTSIRPKTTDYRSIDIAWLRRKGVQNVGYSGSVRWSRNGEQTGSIDYTLEAIGLRLTYRTRPQGGSWEDVNELIRIVTTQMHLGGCRHWFACPSCGRRCRILYGGARFRCRLCRGAAYESQYQNRLSTIGDMRWRIRDRLEERGSEMPWLCGLDDGFPEKPPRMHWRTYRRLEEQDRKLAARWCVGADEWLERTDVRRRTVAQAVQRLRERRKS